MALSDVINSLRTGQGQSTKGLYLVKRRDNTVYNTAGFVDHGFTDNVQIEATVQPLSGSELQVLPEGYNATETLKLYTTTRLYAAGDERVADRVIFLEVHYEVFSVLYYQGFGAGTGGDHYKCLISRID